MKILKMNNTSYINRHNHIRVIISMALLFLVSGKSLWAQSELSTEFELFGGNEYNIFKSPDVLLDRETREPLPIDSIIYTDLFIDAGFDIEFVRTHANKSITEIGSDLWYRNYIEFTDLNQARMQLYATHTRMVSEQFSMGSEYQFMWSDRIGTSVTGDLLMRSFKYFGNAGQFFVDFTPSDNSTTTAFIEYEHKNYYDERTTRPLDHGNLELNIETEYEFNRDNDVGIEIYFIDRKYFSYPSLDSAGDFDVTHPLRHFRYYGAEFDYNWTPIRGLMINPGLELRRRIDFYQDYYSYNVLGANLRLRYMTGDFYFSFYGDYKRMQYDIRPAFTTLDDDPMLIYGFFDYQFVARYSISDQWEIELVLESDNRSSNTDLEYFKTRRPYQNRQVSLGITYTLPDMRW